MNSVHLHLLINHVPILGSIFAVLLLAGGLLRKQPAVVRAALVAMVAVALATVPSYLSGEDAEDHVKPLPDVSTILMEEHEAAALPAMLTIEGAGALALLALVMGRGGRAVPEWLPAAVLLFALLGTGLMVRVGNLGGQVRHSEIRR
jgi:hypothetical protein